MQRPWYAVEGPNQFVAVLVSHSSFQRYAWTERRTTRRSVFFRSRPPDAS
jgi:hypothetical protein